jgi:integrase
MLRIGEGYVPWTWEEIEKFRVHARSDLWWAATVALYSGQRQADVLGMLWSDIQ